MAAVAKRWTPEEDALLEAHRGSAMDKSIVERLAVQLGRSPASIRSHMQLPTRRARDARLRLVADNAPKVTEEYPELPPPVFVIRERAIRLSIVPKTVTQAALRDPPSGYSALATKMRKLSVQDALEICALHDGTRRGIADLALIYSTTTYMIEKVISGEFFDRLDPRNPNYREGL